MGCTQWPFSKEYSIKREKGSDFTIEKPDKYCCKLCLVKVNINNVKKRQWSEVAKSCPTLCDSMDYKPTRLLHPWDFIGKNIGMDCHFLLQRKGRGTSKLPTSAASSKKQESSRKTSISALLTIPKPLTVCITTNCGKFFKWWDYQTTLPASRFPWWFCW